MRKLRRSLSLHAQASATSALTVVPILARGGSDGYRRGMSFAVPQTSASLRPLCVDLDGTLIKTDLFAETLIRATTHAPAVAGRAAMRLARGDRAGAKRLLAENVAIAVDRLPYREEVLDLIADARKQGRRVILATASDRLLAEQIAGHLGLFDEVVASDGIENLKHSRKARHLEERFGESGFDYVGDAHADLPVWLAAHEPLVVDASPTLLARLRHHRLSPRVLSTRQTWFGKLLRAARVHQWVKNLLVFVPIVANHSFADPLHFLAAVQIFLAFSFTASAVYLCNDLVDVEADRAHPRKRLRPFASGSLPIAVGMATVPVLLALAIAMTIGLPESTRWLLGGYFALSSAYSFKLKSIAVLDIFSLSALYLLRIEAGGFATGVHPSIWLTAFAAGVFLCLGSLKRVSELRLYSAHGISPGNRRPYLQSHLRLLNFACLGAGLLAIGTLAVYPTSENAQLLYTRPEFLFALPAIFAAWLSRMWLQMVKKSHADDPVLLAIADPLSYVALSMMIITALLAS